MWECNSVCKYGQKKMWLQLQNLEEVSNAGGRRGAGENMTRNNGPRAFFLSNVFQAK